MICQTVVDGHVQPLAQMPNLFDRELCLLVTAKRGQHVEGELHVKQRLCHAERVLDGQCKREEELALFTMNSK